MRAASREALRQTNAYLQGCQLTSDALMPLAEELFAVLGLLSGQDRLTKGLTDPGLENQGKASLARQIFASHLSPEAAELVAYMAMQKWSVQGDYLQAIRQVAVELTLRYAQVQGRLEALEDEALRLAQLLAAQVELRTALRNSAYGVKERQELLDKVVGAQITPELRFLALQGVKLDDKQNSVVAFIRSLASQAANLRDSLVASVSTCVPMTQSQSERLRSLIEERYGRPVMLRLTLDSQTLGGLRVQVQDEVIDATVAGKLADIKEKINK